MNWACPVSFSPAPAGSESEELSQAFKAEMSGPASWYNLAREKRGRTTYGVSGMEPGKLAEFFAGVVEGLGDSPRDDLSLAAMIKLASEDLKSYYMEAVTAQPGGEQAASAELQDWFYGVTSAGRVLLAIQKLALAEFDPHMQFMGGILLAPASQAHRSLK